MNRGMQFNGWHKTLWLADLCYVCKYKVYIKYWRHVWAQISLHSVFQIVDRWVGDDDDDADGVPAAAV